MKKIMLLNLLMCGSTFLFAQSNSVQNPATNEYSSIKFQEVDCDSCMTTIQMKSQYYNDLLNKLGEESCPDELTQI